jgi:hypothetical protein
LLRYLAAHRRLYVAINKIRDYKPPERDSPEVEQELIEEFDRAYTDDALRQFREGKAKIDAVREASGCEALFREAHALVEQGEDLDLQIERTVATSFAGVLAQLEVLRENLGDNPLLETIITGIKALLPSAR